MPMPKQIIIADDHPLFRNAMTNIIRRLAIPTEVIETENFQSLLSLLQTSPALPTLVLLDLKLADTNGLDGLLSLKKHYPDLPTAVISAYDDANTIAQSKQYGANGFISKSLQMEEMQTAIERLLAGKACFPDCLNSNCNQNLINGFKELTPNQLRVLQLLKEGKPSKIIADSLGVTEATIKAHLTTIFKKLGVRNRTQAVIAAGQLEVQEDFEHSNFTN